MFTPWGSAQSIDKIADGIVQVSTASHGGIGLDETRNAQMPDALRVDGGWYEEDVQWALVVLAFPDLFPDRIAQDAPRVVKEWFPDRWTAHTGEVVTAAESSVVARAEFAELHANDLVGIAAIGKSSFNVVPDGKVLVAATRGGARGGGAHVEHFYVDRDRYEARDQFGYVIDTTVDTATDETI